MSSTLETKDESCVDTGVEDPTETGSGVTVYSPLEGAGGATTTPLVRPLRPVRRSPVTPTKVGPTGEPSLGHVVSLSCPDYPEINPCSAFLDLFLSLLVNLTTSEKDLRLCIVDKVSQSGW